ncbi:MAG TPA: hypothetical protein VJ827_01570 [Rubrobacter sp.]|nr:hypothetical protein [Rubrobacter sp.]
MRSNRDAVEYSRHGTGDPQITPNSSPGPENEEWAWMVDEDPAFYLTKSGRAPENTGG